MYGDNYGVYGVSPYQQQYAQNRVAPVPPQYNNNYPQYGQQPMQQNNMQQTTIKGRPVSSFDEAKASMIDLDGSLFVFTDVANKRIYTKQIMLDGSAELKTYVLEGQEEKNETPEFVPYTEYQQAMADIDKRMTKLLTVVEGESYEQPHDADDATNVRKRK